MTIPYDGITYTLKNITFVVSGTGPVSFEIKDIKNLLYINSIERNNTDEISIIKFENTTFLHSDLTALSVFVKTGIDNPIKVLSIEFNM